ncbi:MAG: glycoside hydrolase family 3 C-terminal domain-containing protein [Clostridiales bacterium]|nr:glycoside hydrolase family 3 C-terminal domain-containing protein [Clostridiales bacterium]
MLREEARQKATLLVSKMTLEEAASQLRFDAPAIDRLGIPEYNWWNECLHGVARAGTATMFPQAIGLGATFDKELMTKIGEVISTEARAKYNESVKNNDRDIYKGLTFWTPNVNLFRDPRWGRGQETYGEDPVLISELAVPFIKALQGDYDEDHFMKIAACAKHFAVHSGPEDMRHFFDAKATLKEMWETYLPQFRACVRDAKVESVMGAYNRTNGEPCNAHKYLMQEVLRGRWEFEGHYVSDCWAINDFHANHKITNSPEESVKLALETGCDLNCGCTYQKIMNAYEQGLVSEECIRNAAVNLFTTRYMLGMFDKTEYDDIPYSAVECREHLEVARRATEESIVLLKNDGILPLDRSKVKTIGVIGPNADSVPALIGNYYGTSSRYTTVLRGIQDACGDDIRVLYSEGCHISMSKPDFLSRENPRLSEAIAVANNSDLVVLCIGLNEMLEGEEGDQGNQYASGDKKDLEFPETQRLLIREIEKTGVPFIVCILAGSAMSMLDFCDEASAIFQMWYPGAQGGAVLGDMLFGKVNPSGKLPVTFYTDLEGFPEFTDYSMKGRTYRFIERKPMYPFGYGLNYGDTGIDGAAVISVGDFESFKKKGCEIEVIASNGSSRPTEDVLQVYVKVESPYEVKNAKLVAFERMKFGGNEIKSLKVNIPWRAFTTIDDNGEVDHGGRSATIYVGFNGPDPRSFELTGKKNVKIIV